MWSAGSARFLHPTGAASARRAAVIGMRAYELLGRSDHRRQPALHVRGPAPVQHAVADLGDEWIAAPFLERPGGHDIGVSGKAEKWRPPATPRPEVLHVAEAKRLDRKAGR